MEQDDLQEHARQLLERMKEVPPREPGDTLRDSDKARILDLREQGKTQEQIAAEIGCHQSTISRTLDEFEDRRGLARRLLNAKAYVMAQRFIDEAKPAEVLRMMGKLDVVRDDQMEGTSVGVQVVIGMPALPPYPDSQDT